MEQKKNMEQKKKRVVTKIGNIFCVEIDNKQKSYFQYIANDLTELNSSVIRVFKKRYPIDSNPSMEEIVSDEVDFYVHTVLSVGVKRGGWYKVGTSKNIGDTENIYFRFYSDVNYAGTGQTKAYYWSVWKINEPSQFIGEMKEQYQDYNIGPVFPYFIVVDKIKTGKFSFNLLD